MIAAMKNKEKGRLGTLRMLISAVKDAAIEKRAELTDEEVLRVLMSYAKKREEAKAEADKAGRAELASKEVAELEVVREYLPAPLSDEELRAIVSAVIRDQDASTMKDMGRVMKAALERAAGRADGSRISPVVKSMLSGK
jgi:uncharacterized protein YqeY